MNEFFSGYLPRQMYGYSRSGAKMMVVFKNSILDSTLPDLPDMLAEGDLLIFNNSKIIPSSLQVYSPKLQEYLTVNIGTDRLSNLFLLEIRPKGTGFRMTEGDGLDLLDSSDSIILFKRHHLFPRYWWARLNRNDDTIDHVIGNYGRFIRYDHIPFDIPDIYYEGPFYKIPGSVELPSASYSFDSKIIKKLVDKGINIEELTLHCNLGSLEPYEFLNERRLMEERFSIPIRTFRSLFEARKRGNKVIAVGTTVVRALETIEMTSGKFRLSEMLMQDENDEGMISGTTSAFIDQNHRIRMVDGLITGMHEKEGSHIMMLEAFQDEEIIRLISKKANEWGYTYHEFGDLSLIFLDRI